MRGVDEMLEYCTRGHPKALLFKCPRTRPDIRCVQCIACLALSERFHETCSGIMGDRSDYDSLPTIDAQLLFRMEDVVKRAQNFNALREILGVKSDD